MKFRSVPYNHDESTFDECVGTCQHRQALYSSSCSPWFLAPFSLLVLLCKCLSVHMSMMVKANLAHSTKSLTFWTLFCVWLGCFGTCFLCMRCMRGYYGGKGGGGGGVAMPNQYCCVFASLLLPRHARIMPLWCHLFFWRLIFSYIFYVGLIILLLLLSTGFGGRQQDRPPTSKGWTKGGGGW